MAATPIPSPPRSVLTRALKGDERAFEEIVKRYENAAFGLAYRMCRDRHLAGDVAQEIFLQIYRKLGRFDLARPFTPWFFKVATNTAINTLKLRRNRKTRALSEMADPEGRDPSELAVAEGPTAAEQASAREGRERLWSLIAGLPEKYSAIVSLRYLQEMSVDEIAAALAMPAGTVKVRLFRARDLLRRRLSPEGAP